MAGVLSGRAVPLQRPVLPGGARRPVAVHRQGVQRRVPVPVVVVWRVDGGVSRRPAAHRQQPSGIPAVHAHRSVLARAFGKGIRQVSTAVTVHNGAECGHFFSLVTFSSGGSIEVP